VKSIALVSLNTETGFVQRYLRVEGNMPQRTGDAQFEEWDPLNTNPHLWQRVWDDLQAFRVGYVPPEPPKPRPTGPKRSEQSVAA